MPFDWQQALDQAAAAGDQRPTWAHDWPAGLRLRKALPTLLAQHQLTPSQIRCCDLGCGRGLLGLRMLQLGAKAVSFADAAPAALQYVRYQLDAMPTHKTLINADAGPQQHYQQHYQQDIQLLHHRWGTVLPDKPYDLILGGDILYRPECHSDLLCSIAGSLAPQGQAWLADPRHRLEADLPALARQHQLFYRQKRLDEVNVTLVKLRLMA